MRGRSPNQRARLRYLLGLVFVALLIPGVILAYLGYRQLQYEAFYQHQTMAAELTERIDQQATELFTAEDGRSFVDFGFLIVGEGNYLQRSPLSAYPVEGLAGIVSYFQVDASGAFSTPLLPAEGTAAAGELEVESYADRLALQNRVRTLLAGQLPGDRAVADGILQEKKQRQDLVARDQDTELDLLSKEDGRDTALAEGQRVFEKLNAPQAKADSPLGSVAELQLKEAYTKLAERAASNQAAAGFDDPTMIRAEEPARSPSLRDARESVSGFSGKRELRTRRVEQNISPSPQPASVAEEAEAPLMKFESELDPFRFDILDADHFVLHRNVWRDQQRIVQGMIVERAPLLQALVGALFQRSTLNGVSNLIIAHRGEVLNTLLTGTAPGYASRAADISGTLLYQTRLTMPLNEIELIFAFTHLPSGSGGTLIVWTTLTFLGLLVGGFALLYRLGLQQIALGEQQQDFVSAVSHELKTPLTSIRMYGEILKAGWASEEKKKDYYDFIYAESERLTRLINNVLRLARFDRNGTQLTLAPVTAGELVDLARSKVISQVQQAGFALEEHHQALDLMLDTDADAFVQIVINLVDNALKFASGSEPKKVVFSSRARDSAWVEFSVRDFGPGIPKNQMKKIFRLFYRTERELTRETVGTGIGLALVAELAAALGGAVDVRNADPGAEFLVRLPARSA